MRRHILEPESSFFLLWNYEHRLAYWDELSSRKNDSQRLFSREYDFPKTFSLTENQFSQKTYFSTIASSPNAKTGTSAWMHVLLGLVPWLSSSATTQEDDSDWRGRFHAAAQRLFQMPMKWPGGKELFDLLFSFLFVRHPFVRLVSAYQDKVRTKPSLLIIRSKSECRPIPDFRFGTRQRVSFLFLFCRLSIMPSMTFLIEVTKAATGRI